MIIDFLKTNWPKEDLAVALAILREFKENESKLEWLAIPFIAWAKLEQLQEYLEHLVEDKPLKEDTIEYLRQQEERASEGD